MKQKLQKKGLSPRVLVKCVWRGHNTISSELPGPSENRKVLHLRDGAPCKISCAHVPRASVPNIPDNVCSTDTDTSVKPERTGLKNLRKNIQKPLMLTQMMRRWWFYIRPSHSTYTNVSPKSSSVLWLIPRETPEENPTGKTETDDATHDFRNLSSRNSLHLHSTAAERQWIGK